MVLAAVCQMNSGGNIAANASVAVGLIQRAAAAGAQAVFLPEASDFIAPATAVPTLTRSRANAQFVQDIKEAARVHKVFVSVGIHEPPTGAGTESCTNEQEPNRCYNTQLLLASDGSYEER